MFGGLCMKEIKKVTVYSILDDFRDMLQQHYKKLSIQYDLLDDNTTPIKKEVVDDYGNIEEIDEDIEEDVEEVDDEEEDERKQELQIAYDERVEEELKKLKSKNFKLYKNIVTLYYHDYVLLMESRFNDLDCDEIEIYEERKKMIDSRESLLNYIESEDGFLSDLVSYFSDFTDLVFFEKREVFKKTNHIDKYLINISALHILDKLYYTIEYTTDDILSYFAEFDMDAIGVILDLLRGLSDHDKENYDKIITVLIDTYYKNYLYKQKSGTSDIEADKILKRIENENIDSFKESIGNDIDILESLALEFYNDNLVYNSDYKNKVQNEYETKKQLIKKKINKM